jgi:hypothetical protein
VEKLAVLEEHAESAARYEAITKSAEVFVFVDESTALFGPAAGQN